MVFNSLNDFVLKLESKGELIRIKERVSPELEITEITDRVSKSKTNNKALLFENTGTGFPVLINMLGSESRMSEAIYCENLNHPVDEIENLVKEIVKPADNFIGKLKILPKLNTIAAWMPKVSGSKNARCQQNICMEPDLGIFPVLKCWPEDGGKFITLPVVITKDPETGIRNAGMYRMQIFNKNTTGMHWHKHKVGARHFNYYRNNKLKMPVSVILGGDPVYTYSATAPLPDNIDEFILAGFLRKKSVRMVKCLTNDLEVPADADIVIEGYIDPAEDLILEGPFGDHTGFYSLADYYPVFHVTCICYANNAIYPATIVGVPPQEDAFIGKATERLFIAPLKMSLLPELLDIKLPFEGVAHNIILVKIRKQFDEQAYKVMNTILGAGQMMFSKFVVVMNEYTDIHDYYSVMKLISGNVRVEKDVYISKGVSDILDHSSDMAGISGKLMIDASFDNVGKINKPEIRIGDILEKFSDIKQINDSLIIHDISLAVISVSKKNDVKIIDLIKRIFIEGYINDLKFVVIVDEVVDVSDLSIVAWIVGNNTDPSRDCFKYVSDHGSTLVIDGTVKTSENDNFRRDWPNVVLMDEITIEKTDSVWNQLGIGEFIESPSLKLIKLVKNKGAINKS